jgi:hypothetical protein
VRSHDLNRLLDEPGLERRRAPRKYLFWIFWDKCLRNNNLRDFGAARNFNHAKINFVKPFGKDFSQASCCGADIPSVVKKLAVGSFQCSRWQQRTP